MEKLFKDLVIIGGGPGGYELASEASMNGLSVALFEKNELGGTCLNCGCIPTKVYYQYAKVLEQSKKMFDASINVDFSKIYASKNDTIALLKQGIAASLKEVMVINELAHLEKVDGEVFAISDNYMINAENIVIATGSKEKVLPIPGIEYAVGSKELLDLDYLPKSLAIIGGGVIGMEMASIYSSLGVNVTVFEYFPNILPSVDKEVSRRLQNLLKQGGVVFYTGASVNLIKKDEEGYMVKALANGKEIQAFAEVVLSCTGRSANVDNLGLEEVGITYSNKGISVNEFFQTNLEKVYAIGDCNGQIMLAHKASFDGKAVLAHILVQEFKPKFEYIPACCFTLPEVATIGLSEDICKEKGIEYKVVKELYRANGKAQAIKETDGFVKLIISDDNIVGASIIGADANLLIHEIAIMMDANVNIKDAKAYIHAHPTLSEIIQNCLQKA